MIASVLAASVSNAVNDAFRRSDVYEQTIRNITQTIFVDPGTPFRIIVWLGTMVALVGSAYFFTQWTQNLQRGEGFTKIFHVLLIAALLANQGQVAAQIAVGVLQLGAQIEAKVLTIAVSKEGKVGTVIQANKVQEAAKQTVSQRRRECLAKQSPREIALCQQSELTATQKQFAKQKVVDESWLSPLWKALGDALPSKDDAVVIGQYIAGSTVGKWIGSGAETFLSYILWALVTCWSIFFDVALLITALMLPIALGISMFSKTGLIDWVSGMGGLILTKISLLIVWAIVSVLSLAQPDLSSVAIACLSAVFSPMLAIFIGSRGGTSLQAALGQVATVASAGLGTALASTTLRGGLGSAKFLGRGTVNLATHLGQKVGNRLSKKKS